MSKTIFAYRLYDPEKKKFVPSGTGNTTARNRRSIWLRRSDVTSTLKYIPAKDRKRLVRKEYVLVEKEEYKMLCELENRLNVMILAEVTASQEKGNDITSM